MARELHIKEIWVYFSNGGSRQRTWKKNKQTNNAWIFITSNNSTELTIILCYIFSGGATYIDFPLLGTKEYTLTDNRQSDILKQKQWR